MDGQMQGLVFGNAPAPPPPPPPPAQQPPPLPQQPLAQGPNIPNVRVPLTDSEFQARFPPPSRARNLQMRYHQAAPAPPDNRDGATSCQRNNGHWPRDVVTTEEICENLTPEARAHARATANQSLWIRIALGGKRYRDVLGDAAKAKAEMTLHGYSPNIKARFPAQLATGHGDKYAGNAFMHLEVTDPAARAAILAQGIIAVNEDFAGAVYEYDENAKNAVVGIFRSNERGSEDEQLRALVSAVYLAANASTDFGRAVQRKIDVCTQAIAHVPLNMRIFMVLRHLDAKYWDDASPFLTLFLMHEWGSPEEYKDLMEVLARGIYSSTFYVFTPASNAGNPMRCIICGYKAHLRAVCPFAFDEDPNRRWWGPLEAINQPGGPKSLATIDVDAAQAPQTQRGGGRGRGQGRGGFNGQNGGFRGAPRGRGRGRGRGAAPYVIGSAGGN